MRDVLQDRTIVLLGSWNMAILNPGWIAKELFEADGIEAEIAIAEGRTRLKYRHEDVSVNPQPSRVVVSALSVSDECLQRTEAAAARLLELLPITPVSAIGINFGYSQEQLPENIAKIFNTADVALIGQHGLAIKQSNLVRHLTFEDRELRLRLTITEDLSLRVHLNYHKAVAHANEARDAILEKAIVYRRKGEELLRAIYGLERENDE
ncbi:MAG: hypothetical protein F9K29_22580 [Hyphomicrobiaceae bacterium]|nr:MAG: hypothetical protein F9K29_22580 [Hyphomicrobiaceae bacterium]